MLLLENLRQHTRASAAEEVAGAGVKFASIGRPRASSWHGNPHGMRLARFAAAAAAAAAALLAACSASAAELNFTLDGATALHRFDGHGALSAGASSRLLWDYPEPQRSQVLDYLFKPNFGMGLSILKVEIGGDGQSTDGTEPSHRHTRGDLSCARGYELFLIKEALKRNPQVLVYGLSWATPGWVNNGTYYGPEQVDYQTSWVQCIQNETGHVVDYMGASSRAEPSRVELEAARRRFDERRDGLARPLARSIARSLAR